MRPPANRKARLSHEFDDYFPGVDGNDLQALNGLCLEWRVDLEPNICAQEAMIKAMQAAAGCGLLVLGSYSGPIRTT